MILTHSVAERVLIALFDKSPMVRPRLAKEINATLPSVYHATETLLLLGLIEFVEPIKSRKNPVRITDKGLEVVNNIIKLSKLIKEPIFTFKGLNKHKRT